MRASASLGLCVLEFRLFLCNRTLCSSAAEEQYQINKEMTNISSSNRGGET